MVLLILSRATMKGRKLKQAETISTILFAVTTMKLLLHPISSTIAMDIIDEKHKQVEERNDEDNNDETITKTATTPTTTGKEENQEVDDHNQEYNSKEVDVDVVFILFPKNKDYNNDKKKQ